MTFNTSMIQARRTYADGLTNVIELSRMFKVSPGTVNIWIEMYDFEGYASRRVSMLSKIAVDEATSKESEIPTALSLLKSQLLFHVREGDITFTSVGEVKQLIETLHLIEGKPTSIVQTLSEQLSDKQLSDMTNDEVLTMASKYVEQGGISAMKN